MDQSLLYQSMCRKAREVQEQWSPARGDVYLLTGDNRIHFWLHETGSQTFKKGFAILHEKNIIRLEARIWLPRQNQLMDLALTPGVRFQDMGFRFHSFAGTPSDRDKDPELRRFSTLEQLWLAFVMCSRFGKRWDNHNWVPITNPTP